MQHIATYLHGKYKRIQLKKRGRSALKTLLQVTVGRVLGIAIQTCQILSSLRQGQTDQKNQRTHSTLFDENVKMGTANNLRTYKANPLDDNNLPTRGMYRILSKEKLSPNEQLLFYRP